MRVPPRPRRLDDDVRRSPLKAGGATALCLAAAALAGVFAPAPRATAATTTGTPGFSELINSLTHTTDPATGTYSARQMSVEVALAPRNQAGLDRELNAVYTKGSGQYHQFLGKGEFDQRYAPPATTTNAVTSYLTDRGLSVSPTDSPFLLRATGSSAQIASAFRTSLTDYKDSRGIRYFANSKPVYLPTSISSAVTGVIGLSNTVRMHSLAAHPTTQATKHAGAASSSCETGYATTKQLFANASSGTSFKHGYGDGPGCTGLTPSQTNSLYGAPKAGSTTKGAGTTAAVFELSAYQKSDTDTWARRFYGSSYSPDISDVNVDGGPLSTSSCPTLDICTSGYSGDVEVDADIEQEMAVAPDAHLDVYNAPNDNTGQTSLDEYTAIANDDTADTVSSSWGVCENDAGQSYSQSENTVFKQMALQGQSVFVASGDTGAFDCIRGDNSDAPGVDDPASQPYVTSVGGTSMETDNPGTNPNPGPPGAGVESVWNVDNLCSNAAASAGNDDEGGYYWCANSGASGGGSSQFWGAPSWQRGQGVDSSSTKYGTSSCSLASGSSTPCRQVPDVSANGDEYTPYTEYCTGSSTTLNSYCGQLSGGGWFGIGGTSLAAPLWGALIADRDGYKGGRSGNVGSLIYPNPSKYLNDIATPAKSTEKGVIPATGNGLFPATPGYDESTGLGSPKFAAIITG